MFDHGTWYYIPRCVGIIIKHELVDWLCICLIIEWTWVQNLVGAKLIFLCVWNICCVYLFYLQNSMLRICSVHMVLIYFIFCAILFCLCASLKSITFCILMAYIYEKSWWLSFFLFSSEACACHEYQLRKKKVMEFNPHDETHSDATKVLFGIRFCSWLGTLEGPIAFFYFFLFVSWYRQEIHLSFLF